ncbi:hypothetical protein SOM12_03775 [Flavobacterium sp. CFBP9031]|uniref:hypothetical protein n=1 Tax=unclassified Flavobacterium TaxID=196869 RepID=UPI002A6B625F|nr:hypothetical protein [Flavobacterium sp. CFBP9031]MDY0986519.1 hypothetical protein [Flavobacterium sp. CFBP9031]
MKLIENFYCIQSVNFENDIEGISSIKTELIRPSIKILEVEYSEKKNYRKRLVGDLSGDSHEYFSLEELLFLSKTYGFEIEESIYSKGYYYSVLKIHKLYDVPGYITLMELDEKEYLMIEFNRWQFDYQPRGAGEDSLGEDVTYILGIWESPLLTDEIIAKIKRR